MIEVLPGDGECGKFSWGGDLHEMYMKKHAKIWFYARISFRPASDYTYIFYKEPVNKLNLINPYSKLLEIKKP